MAVPLIPAILLIVGGLVLFGFSWPLYKRHRVIADTPTAKAHSMAVGPVELKGTAEVRPGAAPFTGPFSGLPCVSYRYVVEEQRTRTVTRTVNGKTTTHTETYWATVDSGQARGVFALRDETGIALVDPTGASLPESRATEYGSHLLRDPPPHVQAFLQARGRTFEGLLGINKTMRFREWRLEPGTRLYVLGTAIRREDAPTEAVGNEALLVQREGRVPFIVSDSGEGSLTLKYAAGFWGCLVGGIAAAGLGTWLLTGA